jgi:hypothetical protein
MKKLWRPRKLKHGPALRRAIAIADHPVFAAIANALTASTGRPRVVPYRTVIIAFLLHSILGADDMHVTKVCDTLCDLPRAKLHELGVTTAEPAPSVRRAIEKLKRTLEAGLEVELPAGSRVLKRDDFTNFVHSAIPSRFDVDGDIALDGTPYPTWARWREHVDTKTGEIRPSADPGAAVAHQTSTPNHENEFYVGYEIHLATYVPSRNQPAASKPHLALGMTLRSGQR